VEKVIPITKALIARSKWLIRLRWWAVLGFFALVILVPPVLDIKLKVGYLLPLCFVQLAYNIAFFRYTRLLDEETRAAAAGGEAAYEGLLRKANYFANAQIAADLLTLSLALYVAGGVANPLRMFYIFQIIIASILLPKRHSYLQATLAAGLYAVLATVPLLNNDLYVSMGRFDWETTMSAMASYTYTHVLVMIVTLYVTAYLATSVTEELRLREQECYRMGKSLSRRSRDVEVANRNLKRMRDKRSRFYRVASHELRTPLSAIASCLRTVLGGYLAKDRDKELEMIRRAEVRTRLMAHLVDDMLALARVQSAVHMAQPMMPVVFDDLVKRVVELHQARIREKDITLGLQLGVGPRPVTTDEEGILEILTNLVSNAVKYTPEGGRVDVRTSLNESAIVCEVRDTGIGIPSDELDRIFDEFYRASNARQLKREGTGLGLSIVKEIARNLGGGVSAESELGRGTTVTFTLPA